MTADNQVPHGIACKSYASHLGNYMITLELSPLMSGEPTFESYLSRAMSQVYSSYSCQARILSVLMNHNKFLHWLPLFYNPL